MKKLNKIQLLFVLACILVLVIGTSYAFFQAQVGSGDASNIKVNIEKTDNLIFDVAKELSLKTTQFNLTEGGNNLKDSTTATASLTASNVTNNATYDYYIYLEIENNEYIYTTETKKPEILLVVKDNNNIVLNSADGLDYVTFHEGLEDEVSGFDITTKSGTFLLGTSTISSTSSTTPTVETWNVDLLFLNLDENQKDNAGKSMTAKIILQKDEIPTLANYIKSTSATDSTLILHNGTKTDATYGIIDAEDNNYRYSGASEEVNNFVCFGTDAEECPNDNLYRIVGVFNETNIETGEQEARVKLIKYDYAFTNLLGTDGEYYGNYVKNGFDASYYRGPSVLNTIPGYYFSKTNDWTTSTLNTLNLNTNYINNIGTKWADKIAEATWKIGGMKWAQGGTSVNIAKTAYTYELGTNSIDKTYRAKIGLMYMSDYYYAADSTNWIYYGHYSDATKDYRAAINSNWMFMGLGDWTISPVFQYLEVFTISIDGDGINDLPHSYGLGVRPSFYLKTSIVVLSGAGSITDPYRIA